ncbi:MAG: putative beta-lactamase, partial [Firmicutes bacterium]|nr:putative beta-lactamase [Bacillota bacterium]
MSEMTGLGPIPVRDALHTTAWPEGLRAAGDMGLQFWSERLDAAFAVLEEAIAAGQIPGAVAVIACGGEVAAHRALGWARAGPEPRPMEPDTLFDLASLTKVIATLPSVLRLLEQGAFRLDDPVSLFFPEFRGEGREEIRIRHLLTHTGGLPPGSMLLRQPGTREERIARIAQVPLQERVGTRIIYTDLGFILLGELVARVSGQSLDAFAGEQIFTPLGLRTAGFNPVGGLAATAAATEYREHLGRHQCGEVHDENATALGGVAGHAGLFATAADVAAYGQMWLDGGAGVLSPATVAAATRDQTLSVPDPDHRGFGWIVIRPDSAYMSCGDLFSPGSYGHTGFTGTSLWMDPARGLVVALLTNRVHFGRN